MKLNGMYKFQATSEQLFSALLNPDLLKASIPGCESAWYSEDKSHMKVRLVTPVPGLEGPYDVTIRILEQHEPEKLVVSAGRHGRIGGTIDTMTQITLSDEIDGTMLAYETTAELAGPVAVANNPLFQGIAKHSLKTFFKNLNASLEK
jgi:carbon monoxide dehydrogenase subunit G